MYPPDVLSLVGTTYIYITCTFVHTGNYIKRIYGSQKVYKWPSWLFLQVWKLSVGHLFESTGDGKFYTPAAKILVLSCGCFNCILFVDISFL